MKCEIQKRETLYILTLTEAEVRTMRGYFLRSTVSPAAEKVETAMGAILDGISEAEDKAAGQ